ncbi:MAG: aminodeoxychorismate synthase component I [Legionellales bacterium]|nr:aminodeoxychorismate synthase component I [Legionellales bacterium]
MNNKAYLECLFDSDKPLIIYRVKNGFDVYTDFSRKIKLTQKNAEHFFNKIVRKKNYKNSFFDGYVGFLSYELQCNLINIKLPKQKSNGFKDSYFYKPETLIKIRKNIQVFSTKIYSTKSTLVREKNISISNKKFFYEKKFKVNLSLKQYTKLFNHFSKKIKEGKTYQIKICQKYKNKSNIDAVQFFWKLMKVNTSPESFMIRDNNFSIISCSPETLINKRKNIIITKPIAGTLKKNKKTSLSFAKKFFSKNIKESKEHNMIVDMERNDLSRICEVGSVKIKDLKMVEEYKDLYHYVTTIKGKLKDKITIYDIIKSMMPGGSVIGCPKISTLNLLNFQEKDSRNIYTGSFGYIKSNGDMRFNIIIRSLLNYNNISEIAVASGVLLGSTAVKEYNENFIKAKSILDIFKS